MGCQNAAQSASAHVFQLKSRIGPRREKVAWPADQSFPSGPQGGFDDFTVSSWLMNVCPAPALSPLPAATRGLCHADARRPSQFGWVRGKKTLWGGGDVHAPVCAHATQSLWASVPWKQLFIPVKANPQRSSEVIAVRQGKGQFESVTPSARGIPLW